MNIVRYGVVAVAVLSCGGWGQIAGAAEPEHDAGIRTLETLEDCYKEAVQVERDYRRHLARLNRLRELAEQLNDSNRLTELDELDDRLRSRFDTRLMEIRARLDEQSADRLDDTLAAARHHDQWVREHRDRAPEHSEVRRPSRPKHQPSRREIRGNARDRAEQRWLDARSEVGVKAHAAAHMSHAASRLAEKRWREEARDHGAERWARAARRSGMLHEIRSSRSFQSAVRREVDNAIDSEISTDTADREFEQLRWELEMGGAMPPRP